MQGPYRGRDDRSRMERRLYVEVLGSDGVRGCGLGWKMGEQRSPAMTMLGGEASVTPKLRE